MVRREGRKTVKFNIIRNSFESIVLGFQLNFEVLFQAYIWKIFCWFPLKTGSERSKMEWLVWRGKKGGRGSVSCGSWVQPFINCPCKFIPVHRAADFHQHNYQKKHAAQCVKHVTLRKKNSAICFCRSVFLLGRVPLCIAEVGVISVLQRIDFFFSPERVIFLGVCFVKQCSTCMTSVLEEWAQSYHHHKFNSSL